MARALRYAKAAASDLAFAIGVILDMARNPFR